MSVYDLVTKKGSAEILLSLDALKGIYGAQLLSAAYAYADKPSRQDILGQYGFLPTHLNQYGFTLRRSPKYEYPQGLSNGDRYINTIVLPSGTTVNYVHPKDVPEAYNSGLADPLTMNPIALYELDIEWDMSYMPFSVIANYDRPASDIYSYEFIRDWIKKKLRESGNSDASLNSKFVYDMLDSTLFQKSMYPLPNTGEIYYIQSASSIYGPILEIRALDPVEFLKGFSLFFMFASVETGRNAVPGFYLLRANKPLVNTYDAQKAHEQASRVERGSLNITEYFDYQLRNLV